MELDVILGRTATGQAVSHNVSEANMVVVGQTRSGKSTFVYSLLSQIRQMQGVRMVGVDYTGLLLQPFKDDDLVLCGRQTASKSVSLLRELVDLMYSRISEMPRLKIDKVQNLTADEPMYFIVLEELPALIATLQTEDRKKCAEFQQLLLTLLSNGLKAGFVVLSILQRADVSQSFGVGLARDQIEAKVIMRSTPDGVAMLMPSLSDSQIGTVGHLPAGVFYFESPSVGLVEARSQLLSYGEYLDNV